MDKKNKISNDSRIRMTADSFINFEKRLLECIDFIPFIKENKQTISPKFIPIILEACGLIESIFQELTKKRDRYNFKKYAEIHESKLELEKAISIFLISPIRFLNPYKDWTRKVPGWWNVYNKLKHDRLNNYELASYEIAVFSLVALHQLIVKCRLFTDELIKAGWFNADEASTIELIFARISESGVPLSSISCESNLFVSPLNFNFVECDGDDFLIVERCDFSNKLRVLLSMSGY